MEKYSGRKKGQQSALCYHHFLLQKFCHSEVLNPAISSHSWPTLDFFLKCQTPHFKIFLGFISPPGLLCPQPLVARQLFPPPGLLLSVLLGPSLWLMPFSWG